ncbi:MAG: zinc ribbon domain-containing protein [Atopobiaceae bacterium]|jgi:hypothetical protein|nr:zinc ribbon domain-containing protein [Atopobiaceae bacterium]MCH4119852.1 zinc ribbon domain-containing protein [Atopobiaceae bacterium]MCI1317738.1 zinc ribbon domain-containing protein [Atopobiaceae bacterium]MCI1389133.1 zinc ribbon domain-containing protein [Atopobiaceae bacterium]MCI1432856.1 zinc ribbon domain-containing protein [Atopobiaceae bacterium]
MRCPYCGHENESFRRYCAECGALLPKEGEEAPDGLAGTDVAGFDDPDATQVVPRDAAGGADGLRGQDGAAGHDADETVLKPLPVHSTMRGADARWAEAKAEANVHAAAEDIRARGRQGGQDAPDDDERDGRRWVPLAIGVTMGIVAVIFLLLAVGMCSSGPTTSNVATTLDAETEAAQTEAATTEAATTETAQVSVRGSLGEYSWDELGQIADLIAAAPTRDEAVSIAEEYHLLNEDGSCTGDTKQVTLADGTQASFAVADVYHDDVADGSSASGKAGITFIATTCPAAHAMSDENTNGGGWEASGLRAWLNSDDGMLGDLPEDLRAQVVPVSKLTNNAGNTLSTSDVTATTDYLWVPSVKEVVGDVDWLWSSDADNSSAYNAVMNAEGEQYLCFQGLGLSNAGDNDSLQLTSASGDACSWWLRSSSASVSDHFRYVDEDGDASRFGDATDEHGVAFGFCL